MLLGGALAVIESLWIFVIIIPLGLADYFGDRFLDWHDRRKRDREGLPPRAEAKAPPAMSRAAGATAFAGYLGLAVCLWLLVVAMSAQPGAAAAMHALQG